VVAVARAEFDKVLLSRPNQIDRRRENLDVTPTQLLDVAATPGQVTASGLRGNLSIAFQYISFWLGGRGAVAIDNLMEDAATAEISRSQVWQWIHHGVRLPDGRTITRELASAFLDEEMQRIRGEVGEATWAMGHPDETRRVLERVALGEELPEFLTLSAYQILSSV
jgi:malate synthase